MGKTGKANINSTQVVADGSKKKPTLSSRSAKAGLTWPVSKTHRKVLERKTVKRVGAGAPVYIAAVLEHFSSELLEVAATICSEAGRKRLTPQDVILALRTDPEFNKCSTGLKILVGDKIKGKAAAAAIEAKRDKDKKLEEGTA